jgi:hypothetical protein
VQAGIHFWSSQYRGKLGLKLTSNLNRTVTSQHVQAGILGAAIEGELDDAHLTRNLHKKKRNKSSFEHSA